MKNCTISAIIPLQNAIIHHATQMTADFSTAAGIQFSGPEHNTYKTVMNKTGAYAAFGGVPVTKDEARLWFDAFNQKGWAFLKDIHKPVWIFAHHPLRKETIVSVDRYRINWIYWTVQHGILYAASSIRRLLSYAQLPFEVDHNALYSYLDLLCVPADQSIQRDVKKLFGGNCLRIFDNKLEFQQYHTISYLPKYNGTEIALSVKVREKIQASVKRHITWIDDYHFGCFLSGGTDSSSILGCSFLAKGENVPAYSVSFSENEWDELEFACLAAQEFKARHTIIQFGMDDALRIADQLPYFYDEPMGNPSLLATFKCVETAAQDGISYLLAGDGGDEIFGGNERYAIDAMYYRLNRSIPLLIRSFARYSISTLYSFLGSRKLLRIKRILDRMNCQNPKRYYLDDAFAYKIYPRAFTQQFVEQIDPEYNLKLFNSYYTCSDAIEEIDKLLHIDMHHTLGDNDLVKVGISGRANEVGILYPMLDDNLVDIACHLPSWAKLKGNEKRYLFKRAMRGLVPDKILYKKKKGFGVPVSHWLRTSSAFTSRLKEIIFDQSGLVREVFTIYFLEQLFEAHQKGLTNNGMLLWGLYSLNQWANTAKNSLKDL